jgi:hypothetical protein
MAHAPSFSRFVLNPGSQCRHDGFRIAGCLCFRNVLNVLPGIQAQRLGLCEPTAEVYKSIGVIGDPSGKVPRNARVVFADSGSSHRQTGQNSKMGDNVRIGHQPPSACLPGRINMGKDIDLPRFLVEVRIDSGVDE